MEELDKVQQLQGKIERLEDCIKDFKEYDARRTEYIVKLKADVEDWKQQCEIARERLDLLYREMDEAKPSIANPKIKAVYFKMLTDLREQRKENGRLHSKLDIISKTGVCDALLREKLEELRVKDKARRQTISTLEKLVGSLRQKLQENGIK